MKTRLLIIGILTIISISVLFTADHAYALCDQNPDWPERPCYAFPGAVSISSEERWERWSAYYDYKGGEWMEMKRIELLKAIENDSVEKWMSEGKASANVNVFEYYFYKGVIPNIDGEFAYPDEQICGIGYVLDDGLCKVIITESGEHGPVSSFIDALFFIVIILPFFIPGALIFIVVSTTPRFSKLIIFSVSIPAIITILYFLSGLFLGWYPPGFA